MSKHTAYTILYWVIVLVIIVVAGFMSGCTQAIVEKKKDGSTRLKINTVGTHSVFDSLYFDPDGFFDVGKYNGTPSDLVFVFDPLTNTYILKTESKGE